MSNRVVEVVLEKIPETVEAFKMLLEEKQENEFEVAALTVAAL